MRARDRTLRPANPLRDNDSNVDTDGEDEAVAAPRTSKRLPVTTLRLALALAAAFGVVTGCSGHKSPSSGGTVQVFPADARVPAPTIEGESLSGDVINVRDFAGDVVVLNIWGSWCGPCRTEQAKLNAVYDEQHSQGVEFLGIDIRDDQAAARAFVRTHDVRYPSIVDEPDATALRFDPRLPADPPVTVILDRAGRVAAKILGPASGGVLGPLVSQFLAEPAR